MNVKIQITKSDYNMLFETRKIPENLTALSVQKDAYQNTINTKSIYKTLISITNCANNLIAYFLSCKSEGGPTQT